MSYESSTLSLIRHGDYDTHDRDGISGTGLTEAGLLEAKVIHDLLPNAPEHSVVYSVDNLRSLGTLTLALYPETPIDEVTCDSRMRVESGRFQILKELDYLPIRNDELEAKLTEVYNAGRNLAFLVNDSDTFARRINTPFSTYRKMAHDFSLFLISENDSISPTSSDMVMCGREFVYASFRAALTGQILGRQAMAEYVMWYQECVELSDSARTDILRLQIEKHGQARPSNVNLKDSFGELVFDTDVLSSLSARLAGEYRDYTGFEITETQV